MNAFLALRPVVVSAVVHGLAIFLLKPESHTSLDERAPVLVSIEIPKAPDPPPVRVDEPPPPPKAPVPAPPTPKPIARPAAPPPELPRPASPAEPPPAPLAGTTMTSDGEGASWATVANVGPGSMTGLAVAPHAPAPPPQVTAPAPPKEEVVVPVADLMRRPVPPALDGVLEREYPREARMQGIAGNALLRVQILPDGSVRVRRRISETQGGFGEACERALKGARFTPALDREGHPARTEISYRCTFEIKS